MNQRLASRFVAAMRWANFWLMFTSTLFALWWVGRAIWILIWGPEQSTARDMGYHLVGGLIGAAVFILLILATREFFSSDERRHLVLVPNPPHGRHHEREIKLEYPERRKVVIIAFEITDHTGHQSMHTIQSDLFDILPIPQPLSPGRVTLEGYWVAMDERYDDSDGESAVLVPKGSEAEARTILNTYLP